MYLSKVKDLKRVRIVRSDHKPLMKKERRKPKKKMEKLETKLLFKNSILLLFLSRTYYNKHKINVKLNT